MRPRYASNLPQSKDSLESDLHDLTNALAAARSFGEVLHFRLGQSGGGSAALVEPLLEELDRMNSILQDVRRRMFRPGDVLSCRKCGYEFVFRRATGKRANCPRCKGDDIERWRPTG